MSKRVEEAREAFEAWYKQETGWEFPETPEGYPLTHARTCWYAWKKCFEWQADQAAQRETVSDVRELAGKIAEIDTGAPFKEEGVKQIAALIQAYVDQRERSLREALEWYANQVDGCRRVGGSTDGDRARAALHNDGGAKARTALTSQNDGEKDKKEV